MVLTDNLDDRTISEALSLTGVIHLKDKNLGDLSGGEFQRVLLARAISKKPELLVLGLYQFVILGLLGAPIK